MPSDLEPKLLAFLAGQLALRKDEACVKAGLDKVADQLK